MFLHHPFSTKLLKGVVYTNSLYFHTCHFPFTLWSASALPICLLNLPCDHQTVKANRQYSFFFFYNKFLRSMTAEIFSSLGYSNRKPNPSCLKQIQFITSHRKRLSGRVDSRDGCESRSPVSPRIPVLSFSPLHQLLHVDLLPGLGFLKITR